jgi:hypothetical protein
VWISTSASTSSFSSSFRSASTKPSATSLDMSRILSHMVC